MTANVIIRQVLLKRGNTAATSTYTGPIGEVVVDTDYKSLRVQDGLTPGGTLLSTAGFAGQLADNIAAANVQIANLWANAASQAENLNTLNANAAVQASILNVLTANAASQGVSLDILNANAATQHNTLVDLINDSENQLAALNVLTANAATQSNALSVLTANAVTQHETLTSLIANAASQSQALDVLTANAAAQFDNLDSLTANAAVQAESLADLISNASAQSGALDNLSNEVSNLWSNAAIQEDEVSGLRANITAANAAIVTANSAVVAYTNDLNSAMLANVNAANAAIVTANSAVVSYVNDLNTAMVANVTATNAAIVTANVGMKEYVDHELFIRTGNITFNGRTIGADTNGGDSGIVFDSAGNGEIYIRDYTGINNANPDHWLHIGSSEDDVGLNTGEMAIDFNNGQNSLTGHVTWSWDWWDPTLIGYRGTHAGDGTRHAKFVLLKDHDHDNPFIAFDYDTGNVKVGELESTKFTGNILSNYVDIINDIRWANGVSVLASITSDINSSNSDAKSYTDTAITNLVNGAPAVLDTLYEIAESLGNNSSISTTLINLIANAESNISSLNSAITVIDANLGTASNNIISLFGNAVTQAIQINSLNANVDAANAAIVTSNIDLTNYVNDKITSFTGNIEINDTTITTKAGATPTIILDAGGEVVIRDYTGIGNPNPGYFLHIGDALANIPLPEGETHGTPILGQLAIDYASGAPTVDGIPPFNDDKGFRGTVVFDWEYWTDSAYGTQNLYSGRSFREFGLFRDGDHNHMLFKVDLDTKVFTLDTLATANIIAVGSEINITGNLVATNGIKTDNYFFANGAPLIIPPLVSTTDIAPTADNGAIWWNNTDGRAYIKYSDSWVDLSPPVAPPAHHYVGNVSFNDRTISDTGDITPHTTSTYDLGSLSLRWDTVYVNNINAGADVVIGGNLTVYGNTTNISTTSLVIDDSLIYLANTNPGNSIDIGIVGSFDNGTYQHTGFVRDASDGVWKLFSNVVAEPTTIIDFASAVYDPIIVGAITSPTIVDLYANAATQDTSIGELRANITAANAAIVTANTQMLNHVVDLNNAMVANVTAANVEIGNLRANITAANSAIVTANSAVVSYVNSLNSTMTANVTAANVEIGNLRANITAANAAIATANSSVVSYVNNLNTAMLANVNAANAAIVTANNAVVSYANSLNTAMLANVNAANSAIVTANSSVVSYVNDVTSSLRANITAANAAIVTANSAVVSYVDSLNSAMVANVNAANAAIITANTALKSYTDDKLALKANISSPTFTGTVSINSPGDVAASGNLSISGATTLTGFNESFTIKSGATGVVAHNCTAGTVFYHTGVAADFTANLINLTCTNGHITTVKIIIAQGATAYIPNAISIAGASQTINWAGGSPPSGNANKKDVFTFTIFNVSDTYTVLGQLVSFG